MFGRRSHGRSHTGLMLLFFQLLQYGMDRIPPITLATIATNTAIHLWLTPVTPWQSVCIGVAMVWYQGDYSRLYKGAFFHADDWHLYYNMTSFLYKGVYLERKVGSVWFLYMLAVFTACTNILHLYLDYEVAEFYNDYSYLHHCSVGFSGVIFAVKVVTTYLSPPRGERLMGFIPVGSRYACWLELGLIQLLVPNASFTGHLAGILVGFAYVKGPLRPLMNLLARPFKDLGGFNRRRTYTYTSGISARNQFSNEARYTGGMGEDEQLRRAMEESMRDGPNHHDRVYPDLNTSGGVEPSAPDAPTYGWNIPNEEVNPSTQEDIRRRRLARFDR